MLRTAKWLALALAAFALPARADLVLMIDFGATTVAGGSMTNSPYHTEDGLFLGTNWNKITSADEFTAGGMVWSDGTAATGVTMDVGDTTSSGSTALNLASSFSSSALGGQINTGIFGGTSVGTDGIFSDGSGSRYVGFQVGGLAAGVYDVYLVGRNTSTSSAYTNTFRVGVSALAGNFDVAPYTNNGELVYLTSGSTQKDAWVLDGLEGENYVRLRVAVGTGEYLNVAAIGSFGESRGFINMAQIVAIPEPSAAALLLLGLALLSRAAVAGGIEPARGAGR